MVFVVQSCPAYVNWPVLRVYPTREQADRFLADIRDRKRCSYSFYTLPCRRVTCYGCGPGGLSDIEITEWSLETGEQIEP